MKEQLEAIRKAALESIAATAEESELEALRVKYLGKKGELTAVLKQMGKLSPEERPVMGQMANEVRAALEQALEAYARLHRESGLKLCASHGLQTEEEFRRMKEAGVERCHANLETSRRYFPQMCTTHTYEDKVTNIQRARAAGLEVCSGGILGMGESWEDRLDLAVSLAELEISSIPLNLLRPIPGTPYEGMEPISNEDVLRTVAFFRYINPTAWIRMAAGRGQFPDGGAELFRSGANAAITGDMLTTTGTSMAGDRAMLRGLGYQV